MNKQKDESGRTSFPPMLKLGSGLIWGSFCLGSIHHAAALPETAPSGNPAGERPEWTRPSTRVPWFRRPAPWHRGVPALGTVGGESGFVEETGPANPLHLIMDTATPSFVDLDADGDPDFVAGDNIGKVSYYENTGSSVLPLFVERTGSDNPFDFINVGNPFLGGSTPAFVDVDGDGDQDLFVGAYDGTLYYFENTGDAMSPAFVERTGADNPLDGINVGDDSVPEFVDIDADGDPDVFIGRGDGKVDFLKNTGTVTDPAFEKQFGSDNVVSFIDVGFESAPVFSDIDADGDMDLFVGELLGTVQYFENTGDAVSAAFVERTGSDNPLELVNHGFVGSFIPAFTDIDGDADPDFFANDFAEVRFYRNGQEVDLQVFPENDSIIISPDGGSFRYRFKAANLTDETIGLDFWALVTNPEGATSQVKEPRAFTVDGGREKGKGVFQEVPGHLPAGEYEYTVIVGTYPDLVITTETFSFVKLSQSSEISFVEVTGSGNPFDGVDVGDNSDPAFVDIDGDADSDAFVGETDGVVNFFENTGDVNNPAFVEVTGSGNPLDGVDVGAFSAFDFVDIDADGDRDLFAGSDVVTGFGGAEMHFFENTGGATTPAFVERSGSDNPFDGLTISDRPEPAFVDIDGDGDFDAFVGGGEDVGGIGCYGFVKFFENTGSAADPAFVQRLGTGNPLNICRSYHLRPSFVDLDFDGDFDVLLGESFGEILYYENTGSVADPVFVERTGSDNPLAFVDVGRYSAPALADLDGDGDMDVISGAGKWFSDGLTSGQLLYFRNETIPAGPTTRITGDGSLRESVEVAVSVPDAYGLGQNYPNPFNPATRIVYALPEGGPVRLTVFDALGREIRVLVDGDRPAGEHTATFDAGALPSGLYFYRIEAGAFAETRTMMLVK
ncbi:T9SS type A sorting domain-containing protein [Rhodocaloribacter sp.]